MRPLGTIELRGIDDAIVDRLKQRASTNNRSLEDEICSILERIVEDEFEKQRAAFLKTSDRVRRLTRGTKQTPSEVLIREDRDGDHR